MVETVMKTAPYVPSATIVTKRDKSDIQKTGLRAVKRDGPFFRRAVASRHPGDVQKAINNLVHLRAEVHAYLDGYTSRGVRSEGQALARLRKAAER